MKKIWVRLLQIGLLAAVLLVFAPQVLPLARQVFTPPPAVKLQPVLPPPGVRHLDRIEDLVLELTNRVRRQKGLAPLVKDVELQNIARAYSDEMLVRRFFDHTSPDGVGYDDRILNHYPHRVVYVGENLWSAFGYGTANAQKLAREIVDDWLSSPGHRENLLSPEFTHLGVGVSARHQNIRATQEFVGRPQGFDLREFFTLRPVK